jgi:hypothetical protein
MKDYSGSVGGGGKSIVRFWGRAFGGLKDQLVWRMSRQTKPPKINNVAPINIQKKMPKNKLPILLLYHRWQASLLSLLAALFLTANVVFALTALPDSTPTVISKKFYRDLLETGDRLIVVYANIPYATPPDDPVTSTFVWELWNTDNVTYYGSTVGYAFVASGYNHNVYSMYFPAADAVPWTPASSHILRGRGNPIQFATPPVYDFLVTTSEYTALAGSSNVSAELASDILVIAAALDSEWGLTDSLISDDETGQTLSTLGQAFFRGAIYGIQSLAPSLFPLAVNDITITDRTWTDTYATSLNTQYAGTWVDTAKTAGGLLFGVDYDLLSLMMLLIMCVGVLAANIMVSNDQWVGLVDVAFVLVIAARMGLIGLGYVGLMAAIAWIYVSLRLFGIVRG